MLLHPAWSASHCLGPGISGAAAEDCAEAGVSLSPPWQMSNIIQPDLPTCPAPASKWHRGKNIKLRIPRVSHMLYSKVMSLTVQTVHIIAMLCAEKIETVCIFIKGFTDSTNVTPGLILPE